MPAIQWMTALELRDLNKRVEVIANYIAFTKNACSFGNRDKTRVTICFEGSAMGQIMPTWMHALIILMHD